MPSKEELQQLANLRLREAKVLFDKEFYEGARYLSGYVVELALKARICTLLKLDKYPDNGGISQSFKTHKLDDLLKLAGLEKQLKEVENNRNLSINWSTMSKWNESLRYSGIDDENKNIAEEFLKALQDEHGGVFNWIRKYW